MISHYFGMPPSQALERRLSKQDRKITWTDLLKRVYKNKCADRSMEV